MKSSDISVYTFRIGVLCALAGIWTTQPGVTQGDTINFLSFILGLNFFSCLVFSTVFGLLALRDKRNSQTQSSQNNDDGTTGQTPLNQEGGQWRSGQPDHL